MSLLNPILLYALGFLAVPLLILFFVNRRQVVLRWAAWEWMRRAVVTKRRRIRVTEWLKLIAKLLLVAALVLFVARPASRVRGSGRALLVIDQTLSMAARMDNGTRLDRARDLAVRFLRGTEQAVAVYAFDGRFSRLSKLRERPAAVSSLLAGLEVVPRAATVRQFAGGLAGLPELKDVDTVFFLSDFQQAQYRDPKALVELLDRTGRGRNLVFVPVDPRSNLENCSIEGARFLPEGCHPGRANRLAVRVRNRSPLPAADLAVTLSVDGRRADRSLVSLVGFDEKEVVLSLPLAGAGEHRVRIELPPDRFPPDNTFHAVVATGPRLSVLAVAREPGRDEPFELDLFLHGALKAFLPAGFLDYRRIRPHELFSQDLEAQDLVMTFGVPFPPDGAATARLRAFVGQGGRLAAFGDAAAPGAWRGFGLDDAEAATEPVRPDAARLAGGYLGFMGEAELEPQLIHFYRYAPVRAGTNDLAGRLFVEGQADPLVVAGPLGRGRAVFSGVLPYPRHTDLFNNPNFVQFAMRLVWDALDRRILFAFTGEEARAVPVPPPRPGSAYAVRGPDGPAQKVAVRPLPGGAVLEVEPPPESTVLTALRDDEPVLSFGCNVTRADSDIEPAAAALFADAAKRGLSFDAAQSFQGDRTRREYGALAWALLLAAAAFEGYAHLIRKRA